MSKASLLYLPLACLLMGAAVATPAAASTTRHLEPVSASQRGVVFDVRHLSARRVERARLVVEVRRARTGTVRILRYRVSPAKVRRAIVRRRALRMRVPRKVRTVRRRRTRLTVTLATLARRRPKKGDTTVTDPVDPTSPSDPATSPPSDPSTGCSPAFGGFSVGAWPSACWRPYAPDSPINKPLPPGPSLHSNSAGLVRRILSMGTIGKIAGNIDPVNDYQVPYYFSSSSDPLFTLEFSENWGTTSGYGSVGRAIEGTQIRIPDAARYAGQGGGQTSPDSHLTVIDQSSGWEYDLYAVQSKPAGGGTIVSRWGGRTRIDGSAFDGGETTAWGGSRLAGIVRAQELMAGQINHALYVVVKCTTGGFVAPAYHPAGRCADITNAPPAGLRMYLAYSEAEIAAAPWPEWKKAIVRAWARYGGYIGDTGGPGFAPAQLESPETYRSFGYADPLVAWATTQPGVAWYNGKPVFDLASGIDWAGRLRVVNPQDPANH
jgi:hypothetical protein